MSDAFLPRFLRLQLRGGPLCLPISPWDCAVNQTGNAAETLETSLRDERVLVCLSFCSKQDKHSVFFSSELEEAETQRCKLMTLITAVCPSLPSSFEEMKREPAWAVLLITLAHHMIVNMDGDGWRASGERSSSPFINTLSRRLSAFPRSVTGVWTGWRSPPCRGFVMWGVQTFWSDLVTWWILKCKCDESDSLLDSLCLWHKALWDDGRGSLSVELFIFVNQCC